MKKSNLDERQELKLLQIEHNGCWFAFWGLLVALIVQTFLNPGEWKIMAGEWIVFMVLALYLAIGCIRNGIWDRRFKPSAKINLLMSVVAGIVVAVLNFSVSYFRYQNLIGSVFAAVFCFFFTAVLCFGALTVSVKLYHKRVHKLDEKIDED